MLNLKKMVSALLGVTMIANMALSIPAFAEETVDRTYVYDDYEITYDVTNSWGNTETIDISITNTGNETIENWMLAYDDFNGEISNIWDAKVTETDSGYQYVRNVGYNANIEPNQSISFGYTLDDYTGIPDVLVMTQERLEKSTASYDATLNIINEWDSTFQGEIVLTNNTDNPIEWWEFTFDSNFTITEVTTSWAASVVNNGNCNYTFKGTYTGIIDDNSSVSLGFQAIKNGTPEISDLHLSDVIYNGVEADNEYNLVNIGDAYFKNIESINDIDTDENGLQYVKNQFLVTAYNDVSYDEVEALGEAYDAEIVGYIELTNDYQFEILYDVDATDIYDIIDELSDNPKVEYASINPVIESEMDLAPNDPWSPNEIIDWNTLYPDGSNWGVEAIDAPGAWEYVEQMSEVKIGLVDNMFDTEHEDVNFFNTWNNPTKITSDHGTHVAGTIAATFDNGVGISGIVPYHRLYAVSRTGIVQDNMQIKNTSMEWKYMLALLIGNKVKVINSSMNDKRFGSHNIEQCAVILENFLQKLINLGYDFVIVSSAGNQSEYDNPFSADDNSLLNAIQNPIVMNRIIVVGSVGINDDNSYYRAVSSCEGARVDVAAPGVGIYSTGKNNQYIYMGGTSMATPHVTGLAGLLYSINPNLSAEQVKQIIVNTSGGEDRVVTDQLNCSYGIINAREAVKVALATDGENTPTNEPVVYVRDYVTGRQVDNATIRIQGRDAQNQNVDMYLKEGEKSNIVTGWYNMTVSATGYVTYRFNAYHSSEGFTIINLVEDNPDSNGTLQITAKDWINNTISNTEFNLYTINESFEKVLLNTEGTYPTTSGMTDNISLAPGYYLAEATTGFSQYTQYLYPVAANYATNETYLRFGLEGTVKTYGFEVSVEGNEQLNINFQLAARASEESLRLDESIIATNVHPNNYDGVYFHFFDTDSVRNNKTFSIGFKLTQDEYNRIVSMEDPSALSGQIMISHGLHGTPSTETVWLTGTDIIDGYNASDGFFEFATIAYDFDLQSYVVSSDYWLIDSE